MSPKTSSKTRRIKKVQEYISFVIFTSLFLSLRKLRTIFRSLSLSLSLSVSLFFLLFLHFPNFAQLYLYLTLSHPRYLFFSSSFFWINLVNLFAVIYTFFLEVLTMMLLFTIFMMDLGFNPWLIYQMVYQKQVFTCGRISVI